MRLAGQIVALGVIGLAFNSSVLGDESVHAGSLFDRHKLTLEPGERTEAFGPFFYETKTDEETIVAVPPFFSHTIKPEVEYEGYDILYPLLSFDRYGKEYRWHVGQLLSFAGGQNQTEVERDRFTLFPIYFQQRSSDSNENYTAVFPFYGQVRNRIFRSEMEFVMWPIYVKSVKRASVSSLPDDPFTMPKYRYLNARRGEVTTHNYVYPFFHLRTGDGLSGWQFWPIVGREHKDITTKTNNWGDVDTIPGHDKRFVLWPFYFKQELDIGSDNPESTVVVLPFYRRLSSPQRDSVSYGTPFGLTITDDRLQKYHEVDAPWPFIVFARGDKTVNRVFPFYSRAYNKSVENNSYLWPVYKFNGIHGDILDRGRTRIGLFIYQHTQDNNLETGKHRSRTDLWPIFTHRRSFDGNTRLQVLALLESFLPTTPSIERNWSPLWTVWRGEKNPATGETSQSLLWNLYRRETSPTTKKGSLLFGLFQYESSAESKRWRLFYLPLKKSQSRSDHVPEHR